MTKFIAYVNQTNFGCDYTIACGKELWEFEAETFDHAITELKCRITPCIFGGKIMDDYGYDILELVSVTLYEVNNEMRLPIQDWYNEASKQKKDNELTQERKIEEEEYYRLKEKYG